MVKVLFNFMKNYQTSRVPVCFASYPLSHWYLVLPIFFILAILIGVWYQFIVVLNCIFLMVNDAEHLFVWFIAFYIPSLVKCLFNSFVHFKIRLFSYS